MPQKTWWSHNSAVHTVKFKAGVVVSPVLSTSLLAHGSAATLQSHGPDYRAVRPLCSCSLLLVREENRERRLRFLWLDIYLTFPCCVQVLSKKTKFSPTTEYRFFFFFFLF